MKKIPLSSSRAFLLSAPTFLLSIPMDNSDATRKKSYKMQQTQLKYIQFPEYRSRFLSIDSEKIGEKSPKYIYFLKIILICNILE